MKNPTGLEPYYELSLIRKSQSTFDSFRNMWLRLHQKSSVGRYVGVMVDPTWVSFKKFLQDMGERPAGFSLDRVDSSGGYCKVNCRWASAKTQSENRRNVTWVNDGDETLTLKSMCRKHDRDYQAVHYRLTTAGWTIDEALSTPIGVKGTNNTTARTSTGGFSIEAKGNSTRLRDG